MPLVDYPRGPQRRVVPSRLHAMASLAGGGALSYLPGSCVPDMSDLVGRGIIISGGAFVSADAVLEGDIFIGPGTVINPLCEIRAVSGPICIGEDNIFEERVVVRSDHPEGMGTMIGNLNLFEVGSIVEACDIGTCNLIGIKAHLRSGSEVASGCVISAAAFVEANEKLENHTIVYRIGDACRQRIQPRAQNLHFGIFRKYLDAIQEPDSRTNVANGLTLRP